MCNLIRSCKTITRFRIMCIFITYEIFFIPISISVSTLIYQTLIKCQIFFIYSLTESESNDITYKSFPYSSVQISHQQNAVVNISHKESELHLNLALPLLRQWHQTNHLIWAFIKWGYIRSRVIRFVRGLSYTIYLRVKLSVWHKVVGSDLYNISYLYNNFSI